jgi:hypothetical protein
MQDIVTPSEFLRMATWMGTPKNENDDSRALRDRTDHLLSYTLMARSHTYGDCIIHLDGAKYHKRRAEKIPTLNCRKDVISEWLERHNVDLSMAKTKADLVALLKN